MYIASASTVVKFHEFPTNNLIHTYQPNSKFDGSCRSLSWSKDGSWLAVVPHAGFTEIITLKGKCKLLHTVLDVSEPSCAGFQNLTKRNLAVGTKHGQVLLYDIKARTVKARYPRTSSAITHVGFTAKDTHCYAGCANGDVLLFNNVAKNLSCTLTVPKSTSITDLKAHAQKRNFLIGGSNEGMIVVWDTNANKIKFLNEAHKAPVTATIFSPINTSLVVSAGLDRQVCVFDIENKQRITNIPVENNIMSLDFLDDSMYIVMGSQNGKLHIYDSRNLPQPVCSFAAHQSAIRHVAYQGISDDGRLGSNSCSLGSIASEDLLRATELNEEVQTRGKRTSDFFGLMVQAPSSDSHDGIVKREVSSIEAGDSFIEALGLDKNNTMDSIREEDHNHGDASGKVTLETIRPILNEYTPNPSRMVKQDRLSVCDSKDVKQSTSTPKFVAKNFMPGVSPIIVNNKLSQSRSAPAVSGVSMTEIQSATKEIVHEEVKKALDELEPKMSYQFFQIRQQMSRMVLDLHMAILKEFIKVENYCNTIRDEMNSEPAAIREVHLLEENMYLKMKVQELENKIANQGTGSAEENGNE